MPKIRLTKNELKSQRDALKRFERYLPTLQLKKQQLQLEVRHVEEELRRLEDEERTFSDSLERWLPVVRDVDSDEILDLLVVKEWRTGVRNVAGIDTPVFEDIEFEQVSYDLFETPQWLDDILAAARELTELLLRKRMLTEQTELLRQELRVTTQRVNLFEKVKIPETRENIRRIQIYLGDQQTTSVGRAKIAKGKAVARDAIAVADVTP
jgi:V/A-type H+-transporting ATPase subunit D